MTITTNEQIMNGVNVSRLFETIEAIKVRPEVASFRFRAANQWIDGSHNRSTVKDFYGACQEDTSRARPFVFDNDEPAVLLGADRGANPVEYVLHALAGCMTTSLVLHASARGIQIEEIESTFEGDIDLQGLLGLSDKVRNGYREIRVTFKIKADAPRETLEELVQLARDRSPVYDTIAHPVSIQVQLADD